MKSPKEIAKDVLKLSEEKAKLSALRMILLGVLAGAYIGFGAQLSTMVTHDLSEHLGLGFSKFMAGSVFSVGLILVILCGAELFTGNCLLLVGTLAGRVPPITLLRNWLIVYFANFAGALLLVGIIYFSRTWTLGILGVGNAMIQTATGKLALGFWEAFFRGIGCNWLVCLAAWLAIAGRDSISKIFGIYFPIMAFVASGFEHSIANMYFIPMGLILGGGPGWLRFLYGNLLPVTLGNIIGGALFVGGFYWLIYLKKGGNDEQRSCPGDP